MDNPIIELSTWTNALQAQRLAEELRLLGGVCDRWVDSWTGLGERLHMVYGFLHQVLAGNSSDLAVRAVRADALIRPLHLLSIESRLTLADVSALPSSLAAIILEEKAKPDHRAADSLYSQLHGKIENVVNVLVYGPADIEKRVQSCLKQLEHAPSDQRDGLRDILQILQRAVQAQDADAICRSIPALHTAVTGLPAGLFRKQEAHRPPSSHSCWIILCVEDDPVWQDTVKRAVEVVRLQRAAYYTLTCEVVADRESAEKRLEQFTKRAIGNSAQGASETPHVLAILDMGIPADPSDTRAPSRDEGLALLAFTRSPKINVPAIVLTTPPNYLGDHVVAAQLGISHYLLKGLDPDERLIESITQIIMARPRRRLQALEETGRIVKIDDVEVVLEPQIFRTLSVLADQYGQARTANQVVNLLHRRFGGYLQLADPQSDVHAENVRLNWLEARKDKETLEQAVRWLQSERYLVWKAICQELDQAEISPTDFRAVSLYLESRYNIPVEASRPEFDAKNIEKHIHEIRVAIKQAFNAVGQAIVPEEEVIVNTTLDDEFAYRILADVVLPEEHEEKARSQWRVLVVENDVEGWLNPISRLLYRFGYEVEGASSVEEAIARAHAFRPDVLCLDMHLPEDGASFQKDPTLGIAEGGLRVLQSVAAFLPHIRTIVFTDLADRDEIRVRAAELGVRVTDFVPKQGTLDTPWEAQFVLKVHRMEQEAARQALLPLPDLTELPYIHLWRNKKAEMYVEVFDEPWKLTPNQYKMLWLLAERKNRPVPTAVVLEEVYDSLDAQEALKQLVKNFRMRIGKACEPWFGITDPGQTKKIAEAVLANDAKAGWILNARIVIDD
jgi:CheY-like chemotaxis protein